MTNYIEIAKTMIEEEYSLAGVRNSWEDEVYNVGDTARESYEWDLEHDCSAYHTTGMTAGGTCATQIEIDTDDVEELAAKIEAVVKQNKMYGPSTQYIIAGYDESDVYYTQDDDEVRIADAIVLAVV